MHLHGTPGCLAPQDEPDHGAPVSRELIGRTRESVALEAVRPRQLRAVTAGRGRFDNITFTRARWRSRPDLLRLRVVGVVTPGTGKSIPATPELWAPGTLSVNGEGCAGTFVQTIDVDDLLTGDFAQRTPVGTVPSNPGTVCLASPNGGAAIDVVIENPN